MSVSDRRLGALRPALLMSAALWLSSLEASPPKTAAAGVPDAAATIRGANADWLPAMRRADAAALAAPYAEDGLFIEADGTVTRGRDAIRQLYVTRLAAIAQVIGGQLKSDGRTQVAPDLVYEWGHATMRVSKKDGTRSESAGQYLTVWHRNRAGRWEIIRNIAF